MKQCGPVPATSVAHTGVFDGWEEDREVMKSWFSELHYCRTPNDMKPPGHLHGDNMDSEKGGPNRGPFLPTIRLETLCLALLSPPGERNGEEKTLPDEKFDMTIWKTPTTRISVGLPRLKFYFPFLFILSLVTEKGCLRWRWDQF